MVSGGKYPHLWQLVVVYFGQDFDLFGDTVEEIVSCYRQDSTRSVLEATVREITKFKSDHAGNLDPAIRTTFEKQFNPEPWGYTAEGFLDELVRLLRAP